MLARVLLAEGRPGHALALLDRLHAAAAAQDRTGSLIEAGALRALALAASCEEPAAVAALAGTLTLACPQGYVRVFTDEGPPMAALLGRLIAAQRVGQDAAGVPLGCLARLQRAFEAKPAGAPAGGRGTAAVPGLAEALTARELEVLGMLAAGRSNQAIASELVVTLDTVKKHVSHVMDKLGAANRTEAVARARELGLIRLRGGRSRSDGTVVPGAEPRRKFAAPVRICSFSCSSHAAAGIRWWVGWCGGTTRPSGRISPVSSKTITPLQSRLQPCSGWKATVWAAPRSGRSAGGHGGRCGHIAHLRVCGCGHCGLGFQRKRRMAMNAPAAPQAARTARLFQSNPVCWANGPSRAWLNGRTGKAPEIRFSAAE